MTDISNDRTSLIKVVLALGEYLTSEEGELRRKGKPDESDLKLILSFIHYFGDRCGIFITCIAAFPPRDNEPTIGCVL